MPPLGKWKVTIYLAAPSCEFQEKCTGPYFGRSEPASGPVMPQPRGPLPPPPVVGGWVAGASVAAGAVVAGASVAARAVKVPEAALIIAWASGLSLSQFW